MIKKLVFLMCFFFLISGVVYASTGKTIPCIGIGSNEVLNGDAKPEVNAVKKSGAQKITKATVDKAYGNLPLYFINNDGQVDENVRYYTHGSGHAIFFTKNGICMNLTKTQKSQENLADKELSKSSIVISELLKLSFLNAKKDPRIIARDVQEGLLNYLVGNDPAKWRTNIPSYRAIVYEEVYRDINIKFYGNNRHLEYDVIVNPGGDPAVVQFLYEGAKALHINNRGELEIELEHGTVIQKTPYLYQEINGNRVQVEGGFKLLAETSYGFQVASYDKNRPLIIDPVLQYSTYLGGTTGESASDIAVDSQGNIYVFGKTYSSGFPTENPYQETYGGGIGDTFVTKISPDGSSLIYSTFLGGGGSNAQEFSERMAVDNIGNVYVTGRTSSADFPTTSGAYRESRSIYYSDSFVTKINAAGDDLAYSTFMGTACISYGIAVDNDGNAYITGYTSVEDFPVTDGVYQATLAGGNDAFITKINAAGSDLVYSTYLGGSDNDSGNSIAVDSNGNAYVAGSTDSYSFPTLNPYQGLAGNKDIFITKLNSDGSALVYSTYLGGVNNDSVSDMALDSSGNVYITGTTSADFPSVNPFWTGNMSASDVFVSKLGTSGSNLVYSTRFGGSEGESGEGIAVDINGCAYVVGRTASSDFPIESPLPNTAFDFLDVFVTKINPTGDSMIYSTYIGGTNDEFGEAIAVDVNGNAFIAGHTQSTDFPTVSPFQESLVGATNVFIAKIFDDTLPSPPDITVTDSTDPSDDLMVSFGEVAVETPLFKTVTITNDGGEDLILGQIGLIDSLATPFGLNHDCDQTTLTQGQSCDFQVFFQTDTAGLFSDSFDIASNDPDEASVTINLEGTGIAFPDITVDLQVSFGSVTVGTLLSQTVTIKNDGHANLILGQIAMDNPLADPFSILNDSCSDLTVSPGASCTFDLSFLPNISGIFEDSFDIPSDDPDETVVTVAVNGMGTAIPSMDSIPPQVVFVTPNATTNISINLDHLTATFSEAMDAATIDQSSFTLESTAGSVLGTVTYDPAAKTAHFLPDQDLVYDRIYTATISTNVKDVAGNALALEYTWNFTTRLEPTGDCSPEIGQEDGCVDFDGFTYGTGVRMSIGGHNILYGPTDKDTGRSEVSYEDTFDEDSFWNDDFESAAKARVDGTAFSLGVRAQDKTGLSLGDENSAPEAHAASRIDVTGIPPGSLLPMTIVIDGSLIGGGSDGSAGVTLRVYDFEFRTLGTVSAGTGTTGTWLSFVKWTNPYDQNSYVEPPDLTSVPGEIRLDFLYPVMPGNGIFVWMNAWAYKWGDGSISTRAEYFSTARLEVNPLPGVQVRLASGLTFTGGVDSDGDGVADNEDSAPNDSSIATPFAATGSGLIEVGIDASSNSGMSLSQVQTFDTSDLSLNQEGKPAPSTRTFPHGLVSFRVNGVQPGGDTTVILTFPEAIPDGAKYYKVDVNGFYEFPRAVISGNTVTLTLTDDGTRNGGDSNGFSHDGVIDDPGGIAAQVETPDTTAGTGGGGGCFISTMKE